MPALTIPAPHSRAVAEAGDGIYRSALFLATFLFLWLTAAPFPDLSDPKVLEPVGEGNPVGQALAIFLTVSLGAFAFLKKERVVTRALTPILVLTFLWFAGSAALSPHAALAARRLVLAAVTIFQAAIFLLLPKGRDHFSQLLAAGALIVLVLCYAGIFFLPDRSIHQLADLAEPDLAGNWRGFFAHKNGAGAGMVVLVFIGIFVLRTLNAIIGVLIVALAEFFLIFTESKSPFNLFPLVLIASALLTRLRRPKAKFLVAAAIPFGIAILTIGSVSSDQIQRLIGASMSDPTFTGRDEIWRFTLDHIAQRPVVGFGFQAFWKTDDLLSAWNYLESWGYRASDAHNGFLNIAVMTGIVGLVVSLLWIFAQPLADHIRTPLDRSDPALTALFLQIWLFGLSLSGFESVLFSGGDALWFMMVVSIIGLRYQATAQLFR